MTAFVIRFRESVPIPVNAQIQIDYPPQITENSIYTGCQLSNNYTFTSCTFNTVSQTIIIKNVTDVLIEANTQFQITLYGLVTSMKAAATQSFQV